MLGDCVHLQCFILRVWTYKMSWMSFTGRSLSVCSRCTPKPRGPRGKEKWKLIGLKQFVLSSFLHLSFFLFFLPSLLSGPPPMEEGVNGRGAPGVIFFQIASPLSPSRSVSLRYCRLFENWQRSWEIDCDWITPASLKPSFINFSLPTFTFFPVYRNLRHLAISLVNSTS